jgi:hypothetical protein
MNVFGPLWAGVAYDRLAPAAPYWIGAGLFVFAGLLLTRIKVEAPAATKAGVPSGAD